MKFFMSERSALNVNELFIYFPECFVSYCVIF